MEVKYFVRTTGEREFDYSSELPEYTILVDEDHRPVMSLIEQLSRINCPAVILEDDLILCKGFKEKIEKVISEHPNNVINFFYNPLDYFETMETKNFCWNQCVYYPAGITPYIAEHMANVYAENPSLPSDVVEHYALVAMRVPNIIYRPCLVQHIGVKSLITPGIYTFRRDTIYFEDYLNELGINYKDAENPVNKRKLKEKLAEDRKTWPAM